MRRDVDRNDQSPVDADNDQREEHAQVDRRNHEQIERCDTFGMVSDERLPTLRGRPASFGHVLGNRELRGLKAKLKEFAVNPWGAPKRIVEAISRMSLRSSGDAFGRPQRARDRQRQ